MEVNDAPYIIQSDEGYTKATYQLNHINNILTACIVNTAHILRIATWRAKNLRACVWIGIAAAHNNRTPARWIGSLMELKRASICGMIYNKLRFGPEFENINRTVPVMYSGKTSLNCTYRIISRIVHHRWGNFLLPIDATILISTRWWTPCTCWFRRHGWRWQLGRTDITRSG